MVPVRLNHVSWDSTDADARWAAIGTDAHWRAATRPAPSTAAPATGRVRRVPRTARMISGGLTNERRLCGLRAVECGDDQRRQRVAVHGHQADGVFDHRIAQWHRAHV